MLKLLHCAQGDPGAYSSGAESAFILEGGALNSAKASFTGLASSSCMLQKTVLPRITLSLVFHCARGISLYTHPPEMGHAPSHCMSPCATSSPRCVCGA